MPDFHEVLFPEDISYGSSGGPGFNTTVIELSSGAEQRNINWSEVRATYEVSHGIKTRDQMDELIDFFYARRGRAYGFRFKDWSDYTIDDQLIGTGDGATKIYQIYKRYEPQTAYFYDRVIRKIVPGSLTATINGSATAAFAVDNNTGIITFNSNVPLNHPIRISCEFHVPVRFDSDDMKVNHDDWETMSWPSIPLVELKPRS